MTAPTVATVIAATGTVVHAQAAGWSSPMASCTPGGMGGRGHVRRPTRYRACVGEVTCRRCLRRMADEQAAAELAAASVNQAVAS